jgi:hypothetical protein
VLHTHRFLRTQKLPDADFSADGLQVLQRSTSFEVSQLGWVSAYRVMDRNMGFFPQKAENRPTEAVPTACVTGAIKEFMKVKQVSSSWKACEMSESIFLKEENLENLFYPAKTKV